MSKKEQILELRSQGLSYKDIQKQLGCSRSLITYHCNDPEKQKEALRLRIRKLRSKQHPFKSKLYDFLYIKRPYQSPKKPIYTDKKLLYTKIHHFNKKGEGKTMITIEQIIERFSDNAICYLTGEPIDITKPRTYQFDHKIPVSKNGDNSIDNLGLCTKEVNLAKRDLTPDEFIALCKKVLVHQGYTVEKSNNT